jgi:hypothetical protein
VCEVTSSCHLFNGWWYWASFTACWPFIYFLGEFNSPLISTGIWFQRDHCGGKTRVLCYTADTWFIFPSRPTSAKDSHLSTNLKFSLYHLNQADLLLPCFGSTLDFWEADFQKIEGREMLSVTQHFWHY